MLATGHAQAGHFPEDIRLDHGSKWGMGPPSALAPDEEDRRSAAAAVRTLKRGRCEPRRRSKHVDEALGGMCRGAGGTPRAILHGLTTGLAWAATGWAVLGVGASARRQHHSGCRRLMVSIARLMHQADPINNDVGDAACDHKCPRGQAATFLDARPVYASLPLLL
jgi:hypothetical protein